METDIEFFLHLVAMEWILVVFHVFSNSVLCLGNQAMNMPEIKFNTRWMSTSFNTRNPQGELMENTFNSCWTFGSTTNEIVLRIDEWIRLCKGEDGEHSTPETHAHRVIVMGMMNEFQISSQGPKGGNAHFVQDAERSAAYFGKFKPGYFMYIGPGSEERWRVPRQHKRKVGRTCKTSTDVYLAQKHPILKGCNKFRQEVLKRCGENMHFSASGTSKNMIIDLISSANDTRILSRICDYFGKMNKDDLESRFGFFCPCSKSLGDRQSVSSFCCWQHLRLMFVLHRDTSRHEHQLLRALGLLSVRERQRAISSYIRIDNDRSGCRKSERDQRQGTPSTV